MELERLKKAAARSFQTVSDLLRKIPVVPSVIKVREYPPGDQQCPPQGTRPTGIQDGIIEEIPLSQSSQHIQNLTEPDTTSSLTSRLTNHDSIRFDNLQTSSISQPPSELVVTPLKPLRTVVFYKKVCVEPEMKMDTEKTMMWEKEIWVRLSKDLEDNGSGVVALEFYMAGKKGKTLRPTVVITCDDVESQKRYRKIVEGLLWLRKFSLQYLIVLNSEKSIRLLTKAPAVSGPSRLTVVANLESNTGTICGISATINHQSLQADTPFKLGGTLLVGGEVFCLIVGHIVRPELPHDLSQDSGITESLQRNSTVESDNSSYLFTLDGSTSDSDTDSISDNPETEQNEREYDRISQEDPVERTYRTGLSNVLDWTEIGSLEDSTISRQGLDAGSSTFHSDWALVRVTNRKYWLGNSVQVPGNPALTAIEDTLQKDQISVGQVWAVTGSNSLRSGLLSGCPAVLFLDGKKLRVRQITFEEELVPGDSGAWVIQDGKLCGHIVAGREGLRWAYMVPIEDIFDEIKEYFHTKEVSILTASMATQLMLRDTTDQQIDNTPQAKVLDGYPVVLEGLSKPAVGQIRKEQEIHDFVAGRLSPRLLQPEPSLREINFINRFERFRLVKKSPYPSPQPSPQLRATSRHEYADPDILSTQEPLDRETSDRWYARGELRRNLRGWQILLIAISGIIGSNLYANDGKALKTAGPGGALLAFGLVGIVTAMVMESISEMIQRIPAGNAMIQYVRVFVDEDLAWIVGLSHWYTYATVFASLALTAAQLSEHWGLSKALQILLFYLLSPTIIIVINFMPTKWFGWIAALGGTLKLCFVTGCVILMVVVGASEGNGGKYGVKNNDDVAKSRLTAVLYSIPFVAYGFLGVESVTVIAYEARSPKAVARTSRFIAYLAILVFLPLTVLEFLNISWLDPRLPTIWFNDTSASTSDSSAVLVLVAQKYAIRVFPGLLTGCMIFTVLSTSNTALYIASRSLYGVARNAPPRNRQSFWLSRVSSTVGKASVKGIPSWAISISALAFFWVPFLHIGNGISAQHLIEILSLSGTMSCLLVWACQCVAYIRYFHWRRNYRRDHDGERYLPSRIHPARTYFGSWQPIPAYIGLFGCVTIVCVCGSSLWWDSKATASKILAAYGAPIAIWTIWSVRKLYLCWKHGISSVRLYVKLDGSAEIVKLLDSLKASSGWEVAREEHEEHRNQR